MSDVTPPPMMAATPPTATVAVARSLWLASFVVGAAALVVAFLTRDAQLAQLRDLVEDIAGTMTTARRDSVTTTIFLGSLGVLAVFIGLEALLLRSMSARRPNMRWFLLLALALHIAVGTFATGFVSLGDQGLIVTVFLIGEAVLASLALVVTFLPGTRAWFHRQPEPAGNQPD